MARGWYGLEVGNKVQYTTVTNDKVNGEIVELNPWDKNLAYMKIEGTEEVIRVVCEHCIKV